MITVKGVHTFLKCLAKLLASLFEMPSTCMMQFFLLSNLDFQICQNSHLDLRCKASCRSLENDAVSRAWPSFIRCLYNNLS